MRTAEIVDLVAQFDGKRLLPNVVDSALLSMMDTLCVALAASSESLVRSICPTLAWPNERGGASVFGSGYLTDPPGAAMCNGMAAHFLDFDDMLRPMIGHPSAVLLPALIAVLEPRRASGQSLLENYVLGLEVCARLGLTFSLPLYRRGWHPTAVIGTVAAACAVSRALGLSSTKLPNALGIAVSLASGTRANFGSPTKGLHAGNAARNGVLSALLAADGLASGSDILETPMGLYDLFGDGAQPGAVLPPEELVFDRYGLDIKPFACCGRIHPAALGALYARKGYDLSPDSVRSLKCTVHPMALKTLRFARPVTGFQAKYSLTYCLAAAMLDGALTLNHFTDQSTARADLREYCDRISLQGDPSLESEDFAAQIDIVTQDKGIVWVQARRAGHNEFVINTADGQTSYRPDWDTLSGGKWLECASRAISAQELERLGAWVKRVDQPDHRVDDLCGMLRAPS